MSIDTCARHLIERFRHYDHDACTRLFSEDQEEGLLVDVQDQGQFPGVRMANGATWFYDRERRPRRVNREGRDLGPMKTRAPFGERRLLCSDPEAPELLFVEGEGDAVALVSVGATGVVACGGVNVFQSRAAWTTEALRQLVTGKRVRLIFDFDRAGQRATREVIQRLIQVGATRVAALPPQEDWQEGWDIEDWLASFDTRGEAYWELMQRLTSLPWNDEATQAADAEAEDALPEHHVRTARIPLENAERPALAVTIYDEDTKQINLAILGPPSEEAELEFDSVRHDAEPELTGLGEGWQVMESWLWGGERYVPDERGSMLANIQRRTVVLPAPPAEEYGTSEGLWDEVKAFIQSWLALRSDAQFELLTAYVFMSYRLFDAQFPHVPYLRFHGPPGTGKGRALAIMKSLCCWSLDGQPTADNLHRAIEYFGEITLCVDEFHLDRGMGRETVERIIDTLNLGNDREKTKLRCDNVRAADGSREVVVNAFSLFGPKIFAGYGYDEHEGLARRTVNIDMAGIDVPKHIALFALPARSYTEAYALRRKLMAFRGAKYKLGLPDPEGARAQQLHEEAGLEIGQIFWPLLEMVPQGRSVAEQAILDAAVGRREETLATRGVSDDSYLLEEGLSKRADSGYPHGEGLFFPTHEIAESLNDFSGTVARRLKRLGLKHVRKRMGNRGSNPVGGLLLLGTPEEKDIFARYGVTHPCEAATTNPKEDPL